MMARSDRLSLRIGRLGGVALLVSLVMLTGCSKDVSDLHDYMSRVKARPPMPIEPLPEMKHYPSYTYPDDPNLRDPFKPPRVEVAAAKSGDGAGPRPDPTRPREQLENFPLDALSLRGTLEKDRVLWALVRDPRGTLHRVRIGNYMGQNHGEIVGISEANVRVKELIPDGAGGYMVREATIALQE